MPVETTLDQKQTSRTTCNSKHIFYGPKDMNPACINGRELEHMFFISFLESFCDSITCTLGREEQHEQMVSGFFHFCFSPAGHRKEESHSWRLFRSSIRKDV